MKINNSISIKYSVFVILLNLFVFTNMASIAQEKTISGFVYDSKTGERLIDAGVYDSFSGNGTFTNEYGFYSLSVKSDSMNIKVYYIGYQEWIKTFQLLQDQNINIELNPVLLLGEVVINSEKNDLYKNSEMRTLSVTKLAAIPAFAGETDVLKTMHMLPGINAGSEGSSSIFVRGGGDGQNLILLDGVPVYNTDHVYGFLSVFNSNAISHINIYKGGFPARYAGRLSSVIDVRMKEGNMYEYHGNVVFGPVSSSITFEGPVIKGKTSFMISVRRTLLDLAIRPFMDLLSVLNGDDGLLFGYYFYDSNIKINHKISDKDRVFLSLYSGKDKLLAWQLFEGFEELNNDYYWGNITAVARWNHIYGSKLFSNASVYYSRYKNGHSNLDNYYQNNDPSDIYSSFYSEFNSRVQSLSTQVDWDWRINPINNVRFGINYNHLTFKPGETLLETLYDGQFLTEYSQIISKEADEAYIYVENDIKLKKFNANFGCNLSTYYVDDKLYHAIQPRIRTKYALSDNFSLHASYTEMTQNIHMLTKTTMDLSTDLWLPSTGKIEPMYAKQGVLGFDYRLQKNITASLETYYKRMENLIEYKEGASYIENYSNWESLVTTGIGTSYGAELSIKKESGAITGWVSYTLSRANRQFDELNDGKVFPFKYDRRHNFSIVSIWNINEKIDLSATWVYYTGTAYTLTEGLYQTYLHTGNSYNYTIQEFSDRNAYRMPNYHRLDISANFKKHKKRGIRTWSLGIYNVYNRKNPYFMYLDYNDDGCAVMKQVCISPLIPSFSYSFKF